MNRTEGLELLVATSDQSFAATVTDHLTATAGVREVTVVDSGDAATARAVASAVDGVVVDDRIAEPAATVDGLTATGTIPVVFLTGGEREQDSVEAVLDAGAIDVFPRTLAETQHELIVERIRRARHSRTRPDEGETGGLRSDSGPFRDVFESVSDGLVVHDAESGAILEVNERYCEITGYDRTELLDESVRTIIPDESEYTYEDAIEQINSARTDGPQLFELEGERKDGGRFVGEVHLRTIEIDGQERVLASVRDITERKQRELELSEQRRLYSTLVEQSPNGVIIVQDQEVKFVNGRMETLTGYAEDDLLGRSFAELMTEDYRGLAQERYERRIGGEQPPQNYEVEIRTASGETRIIDLCVSRIQYQGDPATLATFDDITERRRREQRLQESERRFRLIADHIDGIIYLASADFSEILYINPAYEDIYGESVEKLYENPRSFVEAAHPEDRDQYERDVERLVEDVEAGTPDDVYEGEYRLQRDGERRWVTVARFPVENEDGTVDRIVGRVQDVTERKRREREFEQIFNGVQDAIVVHDPETAEIVDVNDTFCDLMGYSREELFELGTGGFSVDEEGYTQERAEEVIAEVIEEGESGPFEWKVETNSGDERILEVVTTMADIGGEPRHVSINRDVTERKRREQEYEQIFNAVQDAILVMDPETLEIIDANEAYLDLVGYGDLETVRELGVDGLSAVQEGFTAEEGRQVHQQVAETGESELVEWRVETKDGERRWLEIKVTPAVINGEEVNVAIHRDVTEQRQMERRFRLIAERIDEVIVLASEDFSETLYVNPAYETIWGRPTRELYEDAGAFVEAVDHRDRDDLVEGITEMIEDLQQGTPDDSYSFEYRIRRPNGDLRWVDSTGYAVELPDGTGRSIAVVEDITERKRREQRLEVLNRILRHNLRNQLDVIKSHAEVLTDRAEDGIHAERIIAAANDLSETGARARATDQIMSTGDEVNEIDVGETLRDVVESVTSGQGIDVETALPESATLVTNGSALRTAVRSALENAIDYADSVARVALEDRRGELVVVIDDDGPGIPDEELVPIRVGTETDLRHGRGLGLWQLRWSVDKLGGELTFDTTDGTTIRITVPDRSESGNPSTP